MSDSKFSLTAWYGGAKVTIHTPTRTYTGILDDDALFVGTASFLCLADRVLLEGDMAPLTQWLIPVNAIVLIEHEVVLD
jgi:hypothetical protein